MKCCRLLLHQIVLSYGAIHSCCSHTISKTNSQLFLDYHGQLLDIDDYIQSRKKYVDEFNAGLIPECYKNCKLYEVSRNSSDKVCFEIINVSNRTSCNCNCIYCDLRQKGNQDRRRELNERIPYNIRPVLTDMKNKNLIADNCTYFIDGGECSEYPKEELEWLLLFALNNNCRLDLLSSGIKYSTQIEKVLKVADVNLKISPDAGQKETYEKIKRVKAFDIVWKNISKYIKASKNNEKAVIEIKYVLIPGINDNIKEIEAFLNMCKKSGVKNIIIDIEHYWLYDHKQEEVTENLKEAVRYFDNLNRTSKEFNVNYIQVGKAFLEGLLK